MRYQEKPDNYYGITKNTCFGKKNQTEI